MLPLAIEEASERGLPKIVEELCRHANFSSQRTANHMKAAHEHEPIAKRLYEDAAKSAKTTLVKAKTTASDTVQRTKNAYNAAVKEFEKPLTRKT